MSKEDILEDISNKHINIKTNNMIIVVSDYKDLLDKIRDISPVLFDGFETGIDKVHNVKIDMSKVSVKDVLNEVLSALNISKRAHLENGLSILRFESILRDNNIIVQIILYNLDALEMDEQMLLNELYYYNSPYYFVISFVKDNLKTYFLSKNRVLDFREDYQKYEIDDVKSLRFK